MWLPDVKKQSPIPLPVQEELISEQSFTKFVRTGICGQVTLNCVVEGQCSATKKISNTNEKIMNQFTTAEEKIQSYIYLREIPVFKTRSTVGNYSLIHSDEGLKLISSVFESVLANLSY